MLLVRVKMCNKLSQRAHIRLGADGNKSLFEISEEVTFDEKLPGDVNINLEVWKGGKSLVKAVAAELSD